MSAASPAAVPGVVRPAPARLDPRPPGEPYYRHPGDVVRLVLWALAALALVLFIEVARDTATGARSDLARAATVVPRAARQLMLALVQLASLVVPVAILAALAVRRRWRRSAILLGAALAGAGALGALSLVSELPEGVPGGRGTATGLFSGRFPPVAYVAGASAAAMVGKPWLSRVWRRAADLALAGLVVVLVVAGIGGAPEVLLGLAVGAAAGSVVLIVFGTPNRRPSPLVIATGLADAGLPVVGLTLERALGGRAQLYRASLADDGRSFVKVYCQDSRDADLLFRGYRSLLLREAGTEGRAPSLAGGVEHESFLMVLARQGGARCPAFRALASLPDGSVALAMEDVEGRPLDSMAAAITPGLLDELWREVARLHGAGIAHRALRAANVLVGDDVPVIIDLQSSRASAPPRLQAIDRAELLASLAALVGPTAAVASAARVLDPSELAAAMPYLQPLALSAATRKGISKSALGELRSALAEVSDQEPLPLERLIRVRPRTVIMIATLTGAFYILLPQLANVDDSLAAARSANWAWLAGASGLSAVTYVASAVGTAASVPVRLPFLPLVRAQMASSFVNRVTPANVGGMALNVRFMRKAGVEPAQAVTGVGLDVLAGGISHVVLIVVFFAWAGRGGATGFSLPRSPAVLLAVVAVLAALGVLAATRWGRRLLLGRVLTVVKQSFSSIASLARSPGRLAALFGGSLGVTLAYLAALACAMAAFDAGVSFAQVGAVYLGSSLIAAAAPTPGGLGAMEAALVAGFTAIGVEPGVAVAAVLSYRLTTFWLPILPGWLCFRTLQRDDFI